ncbi:MAG: 8-amino-7-oxononanoate synthase [Lentisphaerae bacterium]|nr:8-amino-7-oxononanoate synthase [Lentisphaerota bacterium]
MNPLFENTLSWIEPRLESLRRQNAERSLRVQPGAGGKLTLDGREILNFSSNDYLDLAHQPDVLEGAARALRDYGAGAGASRLVTGTLPVHERLEQRLAALKGTPAALLFGSGFLANVGTIPALVGKEDRVFADRLAHASLIDGILLSGARLFRFRHNEPDHLAELIRKHPGPGRSLVITESVFSMEGDVAPLKELVAAAASGGAMVMVDEAHATGIFGPGGAGCVREAGLEGAVHVGMGTLSKALGGYGGFVASSELVKRWLVNRARSFVFSTALPPAVAGAGLGALEALERNPNGGATLLARASRFRERLRREGLNTGGSASQIVPVLVGDNARSLAWAEVLRKEGIIAVAIRPPTVPEGSARLRLSLTLAHTEEDLERAATILVRTAHGQGVV